MCYLCKYKDYQYSKDRGNAIVQKFIEYIHTNQVPITELYTARDQWIDEEYSNIKSNSRSFKKTAITELIEHVSRQEQVENVDTVPVYRMTKNGEYKQINGEIK